MLASKQKTTKTITGLVTVIISLLLFYAVFFLLTFILLFSHAILARLFDPQEAHFPSLDCDSSNLEIFALVNCQNSSSGEIT